MADDRLTTLAKRLIPLIKRIVQETMVVQAAPAPFNLTAGDGIDINGVEISVDVTDLIGVGLTEDASNNLVIGTPSTLAVATTNTVSGTTHNHAITSSSNPGAAASILASDANGYLQLVRLGCGQAPEGPLHVYGTSDVPARIRLSSDTDELTLLRLDKRVAAGTGNKRWDFMIDDNTGDMRIRPVDANDYLKVSNTDNSMTPLLINLDSGNIILNQAANDGEMLSLKSSDVAHGITDYSETNTYGAFAKAIAASGGMNVRGYSEDTYGLIVDGFVTNGDTTKSTTAIAPLTLRAYKKSGTGVGAMGADENVMVVRNDGSAVLLIDAEGDMRVTGNMVIGGFAPDGNCDLGLTINQGANDDCALVFKSSDVAHGMTTYAETDDYGRFAKYDAATGGVSFEGYSENVVGMLLSPRHTTDDTAKTVDALGSLMVEAYKRTGTEIDVPGADANLMVIRSGSITRFIFDQEGTAHSDVAWTTFDAYDDIALLADLETHLTDPIQSGFGEFLAANRQALEQARLVTFNRDGHHFVNWTRLAMLSVGAIRQLAARLETVERRLLSA